MHSSNLIHFSFPLKQGDSSPAGGGDPGEADKEMLLSTMEASHYSAQEVAARLRVDVRTGLRWAEANSRSKIVGYNELNALDDEPTWMKYVQQFKNPLILLLLGKEQFFFFNLVHTMQVVYRETG